MNEIETLAEFFAKLFTPAQQGALLLITFCVLAVTQMFKPIFFGLFYTSKLRDPEKEKIKRNAIIHLFVFIAGITGGVIGHFISIPQQPLWFWVVTGLLSGIGSIVLFKLSLGVDWLGVLGLEKKRKDDEH